MQPEDFFAGHPNALTVYQRVREALADHEPFGVRTSKSQVAFRRKRGFAYLWLPGRHLSKPTAEVVLSVVLGRHDESPRFKEVVHPAPAHWMHHLEIEGPGDIDAEVTAWLQEAAARAV